MGTRRRRDGTRRRLRRPAPRRGSPRDDRPGDRHAAHLLRHRRAHALPARLRSALRPRLSVALRRPLAPPGRPPGHLPSWTPRPRLHPVHDRPLRPQRCRVRCRLLAARPPRSRQPRCRRRRADGHPPHRYVRRRPARPAAGVRIGQLARRGHRAGAARRHAGHRGAGGAPVRRPRDPCVSAPPWRSSSPSWPSSCTAQAEPCTQSPSPCSVSPPSMPTARKETTNDETFLYPPRS